MLSPFTTFARIRAIILLIKGKLARNKFAELGAVCDFVVGNSLLTSNLDRLAVLRSSNNFETI